MEQDKTLRCMTCSARFSNEELAKVPELHCPACGTKVLPAGVSDDVTVKINWHELRVLAHWSTWWAAGHCDDDYKAALKSILDRLQVQYPSGEALVPDFVFTLEQQG